jgi:hypothetical protein
MSDQNEWLHKLLHKRGLSRPDGRPLYAYRLSDPELTSLRTFVRQMLIGVAHGQNYKNVDTLFCLYAAETFRREHVCGPWAWETVFRPLDLAQPNLQSAYPWVDHGLKYWCRPLIHSSQGTRRFLDTLACEGGLPLRLLQQQSAKLHTWFMELLEDYHRAGCHGESDAIQRATNLAHRLAPTLRQDVVFQLGGRLVAAVVGLWKTVGDVPEPIAALDVQQPDWRLRLPHAADDATVNALLAPLMSRMTGLTRAATARVVWRGFLRETLTGVWKVEKALDLAERVDGLVLHQWLNWPQDRPLPARLRVLLCNGADTEPVAWLTRGREEAGRVLYRREWLRQGAVVLRGEALFVRHDLALDNGQDLIPLAARGADPWAGDLPWVFVDKAAVRVWHGEGSARTRAERAWVVVPSALGPVHADGDQCRALGMTSTPERRVFEVRGEVGLASPQGELFRVTCDAADDTDESFCLWGHKLAEDLGPGAIYKGLPEVWIEGPDGPVGSAPGRREWRPVGEKGPWRQDSQAAGLVWLRLLDTQGAERYRRQVAAVPNGFTIRRTVANAGGTGEYRLSGLLGAEVAVEPLGEAPVSVTRAGSNDATLAFPCVAGASLPLLTLTLCWAGGQPVELRLPYPQRGAVFLVGGRVLPAKAEVPIDRCGGLHLTVLDPATQGRYELEGDLVGTHFGFRDRLPPLAAGRLDLGLHGWQERLYALLNSDPSPDARVRLAVSRTNQTLARVSVSRFDAEIVPGAGRDRVCIQTTSPDARNADWVARLRLGMMPLWDPSRLPLPLMPCPDEPLCWLVPGDLDPGPWWVVGYEGDWARFRPLLWTVRPTDESDPPVGSALVQAVREPDAELRRQHLADALERLGADPDDEDWTRLFAYLGLTRDFTPAALDVLSQLPERPRTLAMALLRAGDDAFERVWSLAEGLPFLWCLIPVEDWLGAALDYLGSVQAALGDLDPEGELLASVFAQLRARAELRHPAFGPLCDWLQERLLPWLRPRPGLLMAMRGKPGLIGALIASEEQGLQGRHDADVFWPLGPEVMGRARTMSFPQFRFEALSEPFRPARCAPFVAADVALWGSGFDPRLVLELRLIRAFDTQWFDIAYAYALTSGLAALAPDTTD